MKIYIVTAINPDEARSLLSPHSTRLGADREAAKAVNLIRESNPHTVGVPAADIKDANEANWSSILGRLQDFHGAAFCDVAVTECLMQS